MAIKKCKECGNDVSSKAKQCPHCGAPQPRSVGMGGIIVILFIGYITYTAVSGGGSSSSNKQTGSSAPYASSAAPESPPLEIQSWRCEKEHGYVFVIGEVKNVSSNKLKNVVAVGEFRAKNGELVKSEDALIDYNPIMPGQTSPFSVGGTDNPEIDGCHLSFRYLTGSTIAYAEKKEDK